MTPIAFDGCFGWLHAPDAHEATAACGVVMCGAIGFEKLVFHRSWRALADRIAGIGHPTLRFDYPGSGDSRGSDDDPDALEDWLRSIAHGAAWLRESAGVSRVMLCGIQLGGLLAAAAAERIEGIDGLILMAPVISGRSYARGLALSAKIAGTSAADGSVEAFGLRLHATTVKALQKLTLARVPHPEVRRILILNPGGAAGTDAAVAAFRAAGTEVTELDMPDYVELTRTAHESEMPAASLDRIVEWLAGASSAEGLAHFAGPRAARPIQVGELRLPHAVERPVILGNQSERMVGILCQPAQGTGQPGMGQPGIGQPGGMQHPAVLICNTGANPHYGYGRLAVALARALAQDGVASLRIDVAGLGDSDGATTVSLPQLYSDRGEDLRAAVDFLAARGHDRVIAFGICTGAFHTLRAGLVDPRICGVVAVNQIVYQWRNAAPLVWAQVLARTVVAKLRGQKTRDLEQELLCLRIAPPNPAKNRIRRILLRGAVLAENAVLRRFGLHTAATIPARMFAGLSARGVRVLAVAGEDDYSRSLLQAQFGSDLASARDIQGLAVSIEADFDHPVGQSGARARLIAMVRGFVAGLAVAGETDAAMLAPASSRRRLLPRRH